MKRTNRQGVLWNQKNGVALTVLLLCLLLCWWLQHPNINLFTPEGFKQAVKNLRIFVAVQVLATVAAISLFRSEVPKREFSQ
ncbi:MULTISPECIES: hypothetical protein [unclassified Microcoleus]|uniref:hypothetical protein n=1 Tax=unclassified Microcoleus TaxID=2642155 RepID=UPI002FD10C94